jgi:hypothetical protein
MQSLTVSLLSDEDRDAEDDDAPGHQVNWP